MGIMHCDVCYDFTSIIITFATIIALIVMVIIPQIGHVVTRLTIKDTDTHKDNITVSFSRVATRIGLMLNITLNFSIPSTTFRALSRWVALLPNV